MARKMDLDALYSLARRNIRPTYRKLRRMDRDDWLASVGLERRNIAADIFSAGGFIFLGCAIGDALGAYDLLKQARALAEADAGLASKHRAELLFYQGVTALRQGENDNCIQCRGETSCILPLAESALHRFPQGSRAAVVHFTEYLEKFPDDLEARWLLNVAHMTLGEYPGKVGPPLPGPDGRLH